MVTDLKRNHHTGAEQAARLHVAVGVDVRAARDLLPQVAQDAQQLLEARPVARRLAQARLERQRVGERDAGGQVGVAGVQGVLGAAAAAGGVAACLAVARVPAPGGGGSDDTKQLANEALRACVRSRGVCRALAPLSADLRAAAVS